MTATVGNIQRQRAEAAATSSRGEFKADAHVLMNGTRVSEAVRVRVLTAAASLIDEAGYRGLTAAAIARHAGMSRASFYHHFANVEDCLVAVIDELVAVAGSEISSADDSSRGWQERLRRGVWALLTSFDRQPALTRACVLYSDCGRPAVLERREQAFQQLVSLIIDVTGSGRSDIGSDAGVTAEAVVAAALRIVYSRLRSNGEAAVTQLHGDLVAILVLPYVGPRAAHLERSRTPPKLGMGLGRDQAESDATEERTDGALAGWIRLTLRTAVALEVIAAHAGANNRFVAEHAGISDAAQASRLLARLEKAGLIRNEAWASGKWAQNAWSLTTTGARLVETARTTNPARSSRLIPPTV